MASNRPHWRHVSAQRVSDDSDIISHPKKELVFTLRFRRGRTDRKAGRCNFSSLQWNLTLSSKQIFTVGLWLLDIDYWPWIYNIPRSFQLLYALLEIHTIFQAKIVLVKSVKFNIQFNILFFFQDMRKKLVEIEDYYVMKNIVNRFCIAKNIWESLCCTIPLPYFFIFSRLKWYTTYSTSFSS